MIFLVEDV